MASLIMHLCAAKALINENKIEGERENEFLLGTLIPDFSLVPNAHYRTRSNGKRFFNISQFREKYIDKIKTEPLYLGYYLHLVQDVVFRDMMYNEYSWDPKKKGNVTLLYGDYRKLNSYLCEKYLLSEDIIKSFEPCLKAAAKEFIFEPFYLKDCLINDFSIKETGDHYFLTPGISHKFLQKSLDICIAELTALEKESGFINETDYAWKDK